MNSSVDEEKPHRRIPSLRKLQKTHSHTLQIGDLTFREKQCECEGPGERFLVLEAKIGFLRSRRIRIPYGAFRETTSGERMLTNVTDEQARQLAAAVRSS